MNFSEVIGIFLSIVGCYIAVLQWNLEKNERAKRKEEDELCEKREKVYKEITGKSEQIKQNAKKILMLTELLKQDTKKNIDYLEKDLSKIENQQHIKEMFYSPEVADIINKIFDLFPYFMEDYRTIQETYKFMLQHERNFSLSYGFSRYINAFRNYRIAFHDKIMPGIVCSNILSSDLLEYRKTDNPELLINCQKNIKKLLNSLSDIKPIYSELIPFIEEISLISTQKSNDTISKKDSTN